MGYVKFERPIVLRCSSWLGWYLLSRAGAAAAIARRCWWAVLAATLNSSDIKRTIPVIQIMELPSAALSIMLLQLIPRTRTQYHPMNMQGMQGMPGMQGMLGMHQMQMPMGMPMMAQQKMPVVVMPYHSKTADKFRRRRKRPRRIQMSESVSRSESDSGSESGSGEPSFRARSRSKKKRRRQILTPVVSYVTKDGYVVYQKKIKKDRAKDWLEMGKKSGARPAADRDHSSSEERSNRELKKKYERKRRRHSDS